MSDDLSGWGTPKSNEGGVAWPRIWKAVVAVGGLIIMMYQGIFAAETNLTAVLGALLMMGYPVARWLDKLQ